MSFDHLDHSTSNAEDSSGYPPSPPPPTQTTQMMTANAEAPTQADLVQPTALMASASAPEIQGMRFLNASSVPFSPSFDSGLSQSSAEAHSNTGVRERSCSSSPTETDVTPIMEALRSKDRIWLLKLADMMESLINERRARLELNPATSYQRMLVHRCSSYYKLSPESDPVSKMIYVSIHTESRIPSRRVSELVPAEESAQPAFKIMRRTAPGRGRQTSQPGSVTGDDADVSDLDPSETSSVTGGGKRHLTIEEREAAYNEARSRIFMGFEPKKENSANSSTLSLLSGSAGRSSAGEGDDAASSAATESEWSGPVTRDRRDSKRGGSSRRSNQGSYNASASGSSRNSRATSPSFTYPSLYDPHGNMYDPIVSPHGTPQQYQQYYYPPYPPQGPSQPYLTPYNYGYTYGYSPPHQPPHHSDPVTPAVGEQGYAAQAPPPMMYQPYMWQPPPPQQGPPLTQATSPANTNPSLPVAPVPSHSPPTQMSPPQNMMNYGGYFAPGYPPAPYPMPPYYPPPGQQMPPPAQPLPGHPGQPYYPEGQHTDPRYNNGNGMDGMAHSRTSSRNSNGHRQGNGNGRQGPPPAQRRSNWSYGPGISMGGMNAGLTTNQDNTGPRLGNRRISNGSQSTGYRTPGDEASSVTSSTSSSSRQTYTSTSSKHPLPARPDWAVGLKAQPTLSGPRHHDHSNSNSRTMSPARLPGHLPVSVPVPPYPPAQMQSPLQSPPGMENPVLQPTDFPPLSAAAPEKKTPVVGGAWINSQGMRSALRAVPTNGGQSGQGGTSPRADGVDGASPRGTDEGNGRAQYANGGDGQTAAADYSNESSATTGLVDRLSEMTLAGTGPDMTLTASHSNEALSVAAGGAP